MWSRSRSLLLKIEIQFPLNNISLLWPIDTKLGACNQCNQNNGIIFSCHLSFLFPVTSILGWIVENLVSSHCGVSCFTCWHLHFDFIQKDYTEYSSIYSSQWSSWCEFSILKIFKNSKSMSISIFLDSKVLEVWPIVCNLFIVHVVIVVSVLFQWERCHWDAVLWWCSFSQHLES